MSEQHVFPDRLRHVLPRVPGTRQYGTSDKIRRHGKTLSEARNVKQNQGSVGASRVRLVCKTCNEGWLNDMEQECFPIVEQIIRGEKQLLTKDDQAKLTRVATSITMVGEWLSKTHVVATQEERERFRLTLEPPSNWYCFIGRNASDLTTPFQLTDGLRALEKDAEGPIHYAATTMAMGPVLLHVIALSRSYLFDPDGYAEILGLAATCPPSDWITFPFMPALDTAGVARVRSYARESFRIAFGT
jgi:hypothetical protein